MDRAYHKKLLNANTKIVTPVKCITPDRSELKASTNCGVMGASAIGPKPWEKETKVAHAMVENFHHGLQFYACYHMTSSMACSAREINQSIPEDRGHRLMVAV